MSTRHVRRAGARRRALGLAAVGTAAGMLGIASTGMAAPAKKQNGTNDKKVTLCHATSSTKNPYVLTSVNANALEGHDDHEFDVIPAFAYEHPKGKLNQYPGTNWPAGAQLLASGCSAPFALAKTGSSTVQPGGTIEYEVRVTNLGPKPIPFAALKVTDPSVELLPESTADIAGWESRLWTASRVIPADPAACDTSISNTATASLIELMPPSAVASRRKHAQSGKSKRAARAKARAPRKSRAAVDPVQTSTWETSVVCPPVTPDAPVTPAATPVTAVTAFRPAGPALSVTKTGPARALRGGFVNFRVTVTNTGGATATGVTLSDTPARAMQWRAVPTGAKVSGATATWTIGDLAAGESVSKIVRMRMRLTATGRSCNTALATATGLDQAQARACVTVVAARRPATPVTG